jgi:diguanylate cyclase (GGDEF)-like protein
LGVLGGHIRSNAESAHLRGASPAGWQFHRLLWPKGIATRLYAVFALGVSIVLVLALAAIIFASQTRTAALGFFSDGLTGIAAATDLDILLKRHRRMVETIPDEPAVNIAAPRRRVLDDLAAEITALLDGDAQHELAGVRADAGRLISEGYHVLALAEAGETASLKHYVDIYSGVAARMQEGLDSYRSGRLAEAEAGIAELAASARSLLAWVLICSVTLVVIVAPASFLVVVGMVRRLKVVAGAMLKLARNEMEIRLDVGDDNDEITEMARAVNVFKANALSLLDHKSEVERLNAWLEIAVNNMSRGLSLFDCDQRLLICNHEYRDMYGLTDELVARGTRFQDIVRHRLEVGTGREGDVDGFDLLHSPLIQRPEGASADFVTLTHRLANGRIIQVAFQGVKDGGWVAVHEDITEKQAKADRIEEMARKDPLTGLGNRRHFHEEMEKACAGLAAGKPFAVHWIDLDRFKLVNDTLGHQIGDQLLQAAATRMERALRAEDFIARLGGDEFVILQREDVSEDTAGILAARLVATLGRPFFIDGHKIDIGGTVGVALGPKHGTKPDILLRCADQALYQAKANGRGQHIIFETPAAAA